MFESECSEKDMRTQDSRGYYLSLLGCRDGKLPESLDEFPSTLTLPTEMFADTLEMFMLSRIDGLERGQSIHIINGSIVKSPIIKGSVGEIEFPESDQMYMFTKKPLLSFHTHPGGEDRLSSGDVGHFRVCPRSTYILGAITEEGGAFLCQSAKSAKLPIFGVLTGMLHRLQFGWDTSFPGIDNTEKWGYAHYRFRSGGYQKWAIPDLIKQQSITLTLIRNPLQKYRR